MVQLSKRGRGGKEKGDTFGDFAFFEIHNVDLLVDPKLLQTKN